LTKIETKLIRANIFLKIWTQLLVAPAKTQKRRTKPTSESISKQVSAASEDLELLAEKLIGFSWLKVKALTGRHFISYFRDLGHYNVSTSINSDGW